MATYAIGEINGGYRSLLNLLDAISFDKERDILWFTGNLASKGKDALPLLRFVMELGSGAISVLGNRDLALLSIAEDNTQVVTDESFDAILNAPDRDELLKWLRQRPLLHYDKQSNFAIVHAGIPPEWSMSQTITFAIEAESALACGNHKALFENTSGNPPRRWNAKLNGWKRLHYIVCAFTRIRKCNEKGYMDFGAVIPAKADEYVPWYEIPTRVTANVKIIFSNKDAYKGNHPNIFPLLPGDSPEGLPGILKLPSPAKSIAN